MHARTFECGPSAWSFIGLDRAMQNRFSVTVTAAESAAAVVGTVLFYRFNYSSEA
jgi:hypothetical protein